LTFQLGLFAHHGNVSNIEVSFKGFDDLGSKTFRCFNNGGVQYTGEHFQTFPSVQAGSILPLWLGVQLPASLSALGTHNGTIVVQSDQGQQQLDVTIDVVAGPDGKPVRLNGTEDVYSFSRMAWLDSTLGIDDNVVEPFAPVSVATTDNGTLSVQLVNKVVTIGLDGFPEQGTVQSRRVRRGTTVTWTKTVLADAIHFDLINEQGLAMHLVPSQPVHITSQTKSSVAWEATLTGGGATLTVNGRVDFDSYMTMNCTISADPSVALRLKDTALVVPLNDPKYLLGFHEEGTEYKNVNWTWFRDPAQQCCGDNQGWFGEIDAGLMLKLRGPEAVWESPNFGRDFPVIPYIPTTWGGVNASNGQYGLNISGGIIKTFSGPRTLQPGESQSFFFDLAVTPTKFRNLTSHWRERYYQVGYGTPYLTPAQVHDKGATVVTLHQGIPGVINGTLVNPYINYPFIPKTVDLMNNYTQQAKSLGMQTKFYYTVRELSNHAVELYALRALQGEILSPGDPYTIPQPGYCQDWDCHGGAAYLHEHLGTDYIPCWQQGLSNGEIDAAVCDSGVSRW
jgi:hypothetical protein